MKSAASFATKALVATAGVLILIMAEHHLAVDQAAFDAVAGLCRRQGWGPKPDRPVAVVSLPAEVPRPRGPFYPREIIARSLSDVLARKPRMVLVDVFLEVEDPPGDKALLPVLRKARDGVVLAQDLESGFPIPLAEAYSRFNTAIAVFPHDDDGLVRQIQSRFHFAQASSNQVAVSLHGAQKYPVPDQLIDTRMRPQDVFRTYPTAASGVIPDAENIAPGDVVIIGAVHPLLRDSQPFPVETELGGKAAGPIITAYAYQTIAMDGQLRVLQGWQYWGVLAGVFLVCALRTKLRWPLAHSGKSDVFKPAIFRIQTAVLMVLYTLLFCALLVFGWVLPLSYGIAAVLVGSEVNEILFHGEPHGEAAHNTVVESTSSV